MSLYWPFQESGVGLRVFSCRPRVDVHRGEGQKRVFCGRHKCMAPASRKRGMDDVLLRVG